MTNDQRQLVLDTRMYRNGKTYGQEKYCRFCWACETYRKCIARGDVRSTQILCVKAENRMKGVPTKTKLEETLQYAGKRKRHYIMYGLKKEEKGQ